MSTSTLKLLPIDWVALSAVATLLLAIFTWLSLRQYRQQERERDKREVAEKIFQPLYKSLQFIINDLENNFPRLSGFSWRDVKANLYLISRIEPVIKDKIEEFDLEFQKFSNFKNQQYNKILDIVCESMVNALGAEQVFTNLDQQKKEYLISSWYSFAIGGKNKFIRFWQLILNNQTLSDFLEATKNDKDIANDNIENEIFSINGDNVILDSTEAQSLREFIAMQPRKHFENTLSSLINKIQDNAELKRLVDEMRRVYRQAMALKVEIEKF